MVRVNFIGGGRKNRIVLRRPDGIGAKASGVKTPEGFTAYGTLKPCPEERQIGGRARWLLAKSGWGRGTGRNSKEPALREGLWVNPLGIHGAGPALRKANQVRRD